MEMPNILLNADEDKICFQEGLRIFSELRKKYSNKNIRDLDIVLNSLCFALTRLGQFNTHPSDYENYAQLVKQIILKNLKP